MERTISISKGEGSINHNTRKFKAKNIDPERTKYNIEFCNQDIKDAYHFLFDDAVAKYNAKQNRKDRMVDNYYDKIRVGKQEKLFHEIVVQIGNMSDMNAKSEEGQLAKEILTEYMNDFQKRNPNLYVFSSHLHMDEETPHLHIDFIPFTTGSKRGLETRVSQKQALAAQGFIGGTGKGNEATQWVDSEKQALADIMEKHDIRWLQMGTHEPHLSVLDFKKKERQKEVEALTQETMQLQEKKDNLISDNVELQEKKEQTILDNIELEDEQEALQKALEGMYDSKEKIDRNVRVYDEDSKWQLPEPTVMQSAKSYKEKVAEPIRKKLVSLVKNLTIKCINLMSELKGVKKDLDKSNSDNEWLRKENKELKHKQELLQEKVADLDRVKNAIGVDKVDEIIISARKAESAERNSIPRRKFNRESER